MCAVIIGNNLTARMSARMLDDLTKRLSQSLSRLSSGSRIVAPQDDAAGLAQAIRLGTESTRNKAVTSNLTNTLSYLQTRDGMLQKVQNSLNRMGELTTLSLDVTKSSDDVSNYQTELDQLTAFLNEVKNRDFNGVSLFGSSASQVTVNSDGDKLSLDAINLGNALSEVAGGLTVNRTSTAYEVTTLTSGLTSSEGMVIDSSDNIYVSDGHVIKKVTSDGTVTVFAGSGSSGSADGTGTGASFNNIQGLGIDSEGNIYAADKGNNAIRKITSAGVVTTVTTNSALTSPTDVEVDSSGNIYVADNGGHWNGAKLQKIDSNGDVTTVVDSQEGMSRLTIDDSGNVYFTEKFQNRIKKFDTDNNLSVLAGNGFGFADGTGTGAQFQWTYGLTKDSSGDLIVTTMSGHRVRKVTAEGVVTTLAGDGTAASTNGTDTNAQFNKPSDVVVDSNGDMFISEDGGVIRKISVNREAVAAVKSTTQNLANLRAEVGAQMARVKGEISAIGEYDMQLNRAISRIEDVDVAQEATNFSRHQILVNSGTAMLGQANTQPQIILRLIG